jgi:hypothetical protein
MGDIVIGLISALLSRLPTLPDRVRVSRREHRNPGWTSLNVDDCPELETRLHGQLIIGGKGIVAVGMALGS